MCIIISTARFKHPTLFSYVHSTLIFNSVRILLYMHELFVHDWVYLETWLLLINRMQDIELAV